MQGDTNMQNQRLVRSRRERVIGGVAGGLATTMNIDPLLVRLGFILLSLLNGIGAVLYVILWFLLPNEDSEAPDTRSQVQENVNEVQATIQQFIQWVQSLFKR